MKGAFIGAILGGMLACGVGLTNNTATQRQIIGFTLMGSSLIGMVGLIIDSTLSEDEPNGPNR